MSVHFTKESKHVSYSVNQLSDGWLQSFLYLGEAQQEKKKSQYKEVLRKGGARRETRVLVLYYTNFYQYIRYDKTILFALT